jgi:FlaG/FlaF family flagellin (archaellin)
MDCLDPSPTGPQDAVRDALSPVTGVIMRGRIMLVLARLALPVALSIPMLTGQPALASTANPNASPTNPYPGTTCKIIHVTHVTFPFYQRQCHIDYNYQYGSSAVGQITWVYNGQDHVHARVTGTITAYDTAPDGHCAWVWASRTGVWSYGPISPGRACGYQTRKDISLNDIFVDMFASENGMLYVKLATGGGHRSTVWSQDTDAPIGQ